MLKIESSSTSRTGTFVAAAAVLIATALLIWWWRTASDVAPTDATSVAASQALAPASTPESLPAQVEMPRPSPQAVAKIVAEQVAAAGALQEAPAPPVPAASSVSERPAFVSPMEWSVLQGVANQSPQPTAMLTRLVNGLRFTKQLEAWQDMSAAGQPATPERRTMAQALLRDLPERVRNGDYDMAAARQLQGALVNDIDTTPDKRERLMASSSQLLEKAAKQAAAQAGENPPP